MENSMSVLNEQQIKSNYFHPMHGFPPIINLAREKEGIPNFVRELKDYQGQEKLCIACTQFPPWVKRTKQEQTLILKEWIEFLQTNKSAFKALHFSTHASQALFNAACHQEDLEELKELCADLPNLQRARINNVLIE